MTGTHLPAVILDISRTVSRLSNGNPTGIDRVELAYIRHFLTWPEDIHFLARFRKQSVFLDRIGMETLLEMITGNRAWDGVDFIGSLNRNKRSAKIESNLRRLAKNWPSLKRGASKIGFSGGVYINVGHGKLMPKLWDGLKDIPAKKICMVHDVIPLDFPEYCSEKTRLRFETEFLALCENVDHLIWNSFHTKGRAETWLTKWNANQPPSSVFPLGIDVPKRDEHTPVDPPYFVIVGTIEPRKNHALLLDIWQGFFDQHTENSPKLHIVGGRGWLNADVFQRLDTSSLVGNTVIEHGYLSDECLFDLMNGASGLLFPSFAEGFGFPLIDAIAAGTPIICSDIPAFKELGKNYPIYADPRDRQSWIDAIRFLSTTEGQSAFKKRVKPDIIAWETHFSQLSSVLSSIS